MSGVEVKHAYSNPVADSVDATDADVVKPSHWNAAHVITSDPQTMLANQTDTPGGAVTPMPLTEIFFMRLMTAL